MCLNDIHRFVSPKIIAGAIIKILRFSLIDD